MKIRLRTGGRLAAGAAGPLAMLLTTLVASVPATGCGGEGTEPSAACDNVYAAGLNSSPDIVIVGCRPGGGQIESHFTNIKYNGDGTVASFDFDSRCTTTGEHYTGRVYNIRRESTRVMGYSLEVNGQDCGPQ